MIELTGRTKRKTVEAVAGQTVLQLALKADVDWAFNCTRGTCCRCRCHVVEGIACLDEPTKAERIGLEEEELEQGYRLGCQAKVISNGHIVVQNKPY
ncbi:2Fe-2S iron-sulfur cluster-binding protein [Paenibacillus hodogayensis]|uniref:2Fe-2S iron-sulfur cluster-binding protein n=1 Tax=Paenibacillus hodogayensis TaxID=279208 RepID=A0ABV5W562_9BACL